MEHFSKYLDSIPTVHEETKYIIRYKTQKISTRVHYKTQNQDTKY
jgi:DTW domain-containing protein YfiP